MEKLKAYFAGAMKGGRKYLEEYKAIVKQLRDMNIDVLTQHVIDNSLDLGLTKQQIFQRDLKSLREADFVVAEVSMPSLGVGYEVCEALHLGKPTLCLCREEVDLSTLINGNPSPLIRIQRYRDVQECASIIKEFIREFIQR
ncbi:MAG: nucleoside 2-deoxyribosyltransferase [Methanocellales archaeon]